MTHSGNKKVVELIIKSGANSSVKDNDGKTASDLASDKGNIAIYIFKKSIEIRLISQRMNGGINK